MGQQRLSTPQNDDASRQRPQNNRNGQHGRNNNQNGQGGQNTPRPKSDNTVLANTKTRKGEVFRAQRRTSDDVNARAVLHLSGAHRPLACF